jgi:hypothetical protein
MNGGNQTPSHIQAEDTINFDLDSPDISPRYPSTDTSIQKSVFMNTNTGIESPDSEGNFTVATGFIQTNQDGNGSNEGTNINTTNVQTNASFTEDQQTVITSHVKNLNEKITSIRTLREESKDIEKSSFEAAFKKLISKWSQVEEKERNSVLFSDFSDIFPSLFESLLTTYEEGQNLDNVERKTYLPKFEDFINTSKTDTEKLLNDYVQQIENLEKTKTANYFLPYRQASAFNKANVDATSLETKLNQLSSKILATSLTEQFSVVFKLATGKAAILAPKKGQVKIDDANEFTDFRNNWLDLQKTMKSTEASAPIAARSGLFSATLGLAKNVYNRFLGTTNLEEGEKKTLSQLLTAVTNHKDRLTKEIDDAADKPSIEWLEDFVSAYSTTDKQYIFSHRDIFKEFLEYTRDTSYETEGKWKEATTASVETFQTRIESIRTQFNSDVETIDTKIEALKDFLKASFKDENTRNNDRVRFFEKCEEIINVFENVLNYASGMRVLSFYKNFIAQSQTQADANTPIFADEDYQTMYGDFQTNVLYVTDLDIIAEDDAGLKEEVEQLKRDANETAELQRKLSNEEEEVVRALKNYDLVKTIPQEKYKEEKKAEEEVNKLTKSLSYIKRDSQNALPQDKKRWQKREDTYNVRLTEAKKVLDTISKEISDLEENRDKAEEALADANNDVAATNERIVNIETSMESDFNDKATEIIEEKFETYLLEAKIKLGKRLAEKALLGEQEKTAEELKAEAAAIEAAEKAKEEATAAQQAADAAKLAEQKAAEEKRRAEEVARAAKEAADAAQKKSEEAASLVAAAEGSATAVLLEDATAKEKEAKELKDEAERLAAEAEAKAEAEKAATETAERVQKAREEMEAKMKKEEEERAARIALDTRLSSAMEKIREATTTMENVTANVQITMEEITADYEAVESAAKKITSCKTQAEENLTEAEKSGTPTDELKKKVETITEKAETGSLIVKKAETDLFQSSTIYETFKGTISTITEQINDAKTKTLAVDTSGDLSPASTEIETLEKIMESVVKLIETVETNKEYLGKNQQGMKSLKRYAERKAEEAADILNEKHTTSSPPLLSSLTKVNSFSKEKDNYRTLLTMDLSSQVSVEASNFGKSLYYQTPVMTQLIRFVHHLWKFKTHVNKDDIGSESTFVAIENDANRFVQNLMDSSESISMLDPFPPLNAKKAISEEDLRSCQELLQIFTNEEIDEGLGELVDANFLRESVVGWYMTTKHETFILDAILKELLTS